MGTIGHGRAVEEAQYTKEQALAWAANSAKWPTRRYRVESQGICSRLLTEAMAGSIRNLRGGVIVEMIPKNREAAGLPSRRRRKWPAIVCPKCKAAPSAPCTAAGGAKAKKVHKVRLATPVDEATA